MGLVVYKGFYNDLAAGNLSGAFDLRAALVGPSFSFDEDSINMDDGTLDEYDDASYARLDCAGVTAAYVDADDVYRIDCTDGDFGTALAGDATKDLDRLVLYRHVGADSANVILCSNDIGVAGAVVSAGGTVTLIVPDEGVIEIAQAA